jgi:hypothetical protein
MTQVLVNEHKKVSLSKQIFASTWMKRAPLLQKITHVEIPSTKDIS